MVFAMVIFTVAIALLSIVWTSVVNQYATAYGGGVGDMQIQLNNLMQNIQLSGYPYNWNTAMAANSVASWPNSTIGLGTGAPGQLSYSKIGSLEAMSNYDYQATKQLLGVGYDYYIVIYSLDGLNVTIGRNPFYNNATAIQAETLPVVLSNGQPATVEAMVWTNTTFGVG